jgi:uncharacterized protein (TIGR03083 family)
MTGMTFSTTTADGAQNDVVRDALRAQRRRLPSLLRSLSDDEWDAPSRCAEWSVHEVARHLCDATLKCTELLRGEVPERFDPHTTPAAWLERSARERPDDTLVVLENASADLLDEVDRHVIDDPTARLPFLYGPVPWSIAVLHIVWDAWVHERDILLPLRRRHEAAAIESRAAASYGLTFAGSLAVVVDGTRLDERIVLAGDGGGAFRLETLDGTVTATVGDDDCDAVDTEPLRGALADVVDSLVGRGRELTDALRGPSARVERLGMLRAFVLPPAA